MPPVIAPAIDSKKEIPMKLSRELAHRRQDGLEVTLLWDARSNEVSVGLNDEGSQTSFAFFVDPACALDAFYHPFVYAPILSAGPQNDPELALSQEG
jgi:hypothetical protein